jgi:hypothetical protein
VSTAAAAPLTSAQPPGDYWRERHEELVDCAMRLWVVRTDRHGRYGTKGPYTANELTAGILRGHFRAKRREDVAGLHTTCIRDGVSYSKWGAAEIDAHDGQDADPTANWEYALRLHKRLAALGFRVILTDSDGKGGYHVRILFNGWVETRKLFAFLQSLVADAPAGVHVETFPKQECIIDSDGQCGNWLRFFGRHYKRDHWTRVWDAGWSDWLEGDRAIDAILAHDGEDPALLDKALGDQAWIMEAPREKRGPFGVTFTNRDGKPEWFWKKVEAFVGAVSMAPLGDRHKTLLAHARTLGGYLHLGQFDEPSVVSALTVAGRGCGLPEAEIADTIRDAIAHGKLSPLDLPDALKPKPSSNGTAHTNGRASPPPPEPIAYDDLSDDDLGIISAETIEPEAVSWVWPARIPVGKFTLLAGEGSDGKTQIALKIASAITTGGKFPDGSGPAEKGTVVILSAEDGRKDTLIPRLIAAGADLSRVKFLTAKVKVKTKDGKAAVHPKSFQDLDYWRAVLRRLNNPRLIIADPIPAYLGRGVNDHRNADVRAVLEPFCDLIEELGVALLGITHMGKSPDLKTPTHKILGSVAYSNLARVVHVTVRDPDDKTRRYFAQPKNNYSLEAPTLAYKVQSHEFDHKGKTITTARVVFEDKPVDIDAAEMMAAARRGPSEKAGRPSTTSVQLAKWLVDYLNTRTTWVRQKEVFDAAGAADLIGELKQNAEGKARWSNGTMLFRAKDAVPHLKDEGYELLRVEETSLPVGGYAVKHWKLGVAIDPAVPF